MASPSQSLHVVLATMGFSSLFLLWVATIGGFALRSSWNYAWLRRSTLLAVHHSVAVVGICLGVFHGLAQLTVPGGTITPAALVVPFIDTVDPIGIGAGVLGLEILIVVCLSAIIQRRLGYARWYGMHILTYAAFMLAAAHVLLSGSDATRLWVWLPVLAAWLVTAVLWLTTTPLFDRVRDRLAERLVNTDVRELGVQVDPKICTRFGFCEHTAPELFQLRPDGQLLYRQRVPVEQSAAVRRAIEVCPARAIMIANRPGWGVRGSIGDRAAPQARGERSREVLPLPDSRAVPGLRKRTGSQW